MSIQRTTTVTIPAGASKIDALQAIGRGFDALESEARNSHPAHEPVWDTLETSYDDFEEHTFAEASHHHRFLQFTVTSVSREETIALTDPAPIAAPTPAR